MKPSIAVARQLQAYENLVAAYQRLAAEVAEIRSLLAARPAPAEEAAAETPSRQRGK